MKSSVVLFIILHLLPALSHAKSGIKGTRTIRRHLNKSKEGKDGKSKEKSSSAKEKKLEKEIEIYNEVEEEVGKTSRMSSKRSAAKSKSKKKSDKKADRSVSGRSDVVGYSTATKCKKGKKSKGSKSRGGLSDDVECEEDKTVSEQNFPKTGESSVSYENVELDCQAVASNTGPTTTPKSSYSINLDILKDDTYGSTSVFKSMEKELQQQVATDIAGCSSSDGRRLAEAKIVNVDFRSPQMNKKGCDSSLATETKKDGVTCISSDIPVDIYYIGGNPGDYKSLVESAVDKHQWNVDGLVKTSDADVTAVKTKNSTSKDKGGPPPAAFGAIAGVVVLGALGFLYYQKSRTAEYSKDRYDTDETSDDEALPRVQVSHMDSYDDEDKYPEAKAHPVRY